MFVEKFSKFFESAAGVAVTVSICCAVLIILAGLFYRKKQFTTRALTCSAVCIALSVILSNIKLFEMGQGGSATAFSMLFIVLVGYLFGPAAGILAGIADGLLQLALKADVVHPIQLLLDYPFAFGALGLAGFFRNLLKNNTIGKSKIKFDGLCIGYIASVLARWFMSFLSGIIFFAEYAEGKNVIIYSAGYNFSYILPEMVLTLIVLCVPSIRNAIDHVAHSVKAYKR